MFVLTASYGARISTSLWGRLCTPSNFVTLSIFTRRLDPSSPVIHTSIRWTQDLRGDAPNAITRRSMQQPLYCITVQPGSSQSFPSCWSMSHHDSLTYYLFSAPASASLSRSRRVKAGYRLILRLFSIFFDLFRVAQEINSLANCTITLTLFSKIVVQQINVQQQQN